MVCPGCFLETPVICIDHPIGNVLFLERSLAMLIAVLQHVVEPAEYNILGGKSKLKFNNCLPLKSVKFVYGPHSPVAWNNCFRGTVRAWTPESLNNNDRSYLALAASSSDCQKQKEVDNNNLLLGPKFLSYYAILFGFAMVGTFLAHVQISTRLICSSCPALFCFVANMTFNDNQSDDERKRRRVRVLMYFYFALYNILGAIMHVNWLPWT